MTPTKRTAPAPQTTPAASITNYFTWIPPASTSSSTPVPITATDSSRRISPFKLVGMQAHSILGAYALRAIASATDSTTPLTPPLKSLLFSSCSQTRTTFHPNRRSSIPTLRSRSLFRVIFVTQKSLDGLGTRRHFVQPCQKHPSINTATRLRGNIMSGDPGSDEPNIFR